jgi:hypothetical protein
VIGQIRRQHTQLRAANPELPSVSDIQLQILIDGIAEQTRRLLNRGDLPNLPVYASEFADACHRALGLHPADSRISGTA